MEVAEQVKRVLSVRDKQIETIDGPDGKGNRNHKGGI